MHWLQFQTRVRKDVTEGGKRENNNLKATDHDHDSSFAVGVRKKFIVKKKRGDSGPALKVTDETWTNLNCNVNW